MTGIFQILHKVIFAEMAAITLASIKLVGWSVRVARLVGRDSVS